MATNPTTPTTPTRRDFLIHVAAATTLASIALSPNTTSAQTQTAPDASPTTPTTPPWYRRTLRWGQTNIAEADVERYDISWWREHWKQTATQGIIINAGGIVAYYPSQFPLHYRPPALKDRDLYGEIAKAAHDDGLAVLARMDSSKAREPLYQAHPDWFTIDAAGRPYRSGEFYLSCINSPYFSQWLPDILREIIARSHPEGITDNNWAGNDRSSICYCQYCTASFKKFSAKDLPTKHDWNDPAFRQWIDWSYARRIEQWDFNNRITRDAGGKDCLWLGMLGSDVASQSTSFRDIKEIAARSEIIMLDNQARSDRGTVGENAVDGKLIHGLLGWDKLIPESMAMYQLGRPQFRFSTKSPPEARMWMLSGFAGGIQPWWHHIGAYHEDRRMYKTAEPVMHWHRENERYLVNRHPIANVAIAWSQRNTDFFGRDNAEELVALPARGFAQALTRARIPFLPLHLDHLDRDGDAFSVLILPNIGAMTDEQIQCVRRFVNRGGALIATGQTSLFDANGDPRPDFALADLFGASGGKPVPAIPSTPRNTPRQTLHTYLRLNPELRAQIDGPHIPSEPAITEKRHPILAGFDETDILSFGSSLQPLTVATTADVLATFIPPLPQFPPEDVWMRTPRTDIPALIVNAPPTSPSGRVAFLPADIDRHFALENFPDHGDLLANLVRWAANDTLPLEIQGPGLLSVELYQQQNRLILHLLNLTSAGTCGAPIQELTPIGPLQIKIRVPNNNPTPPHFMLKALVNPTACVYSGFKAPWVTLRVNTLLDHEVILLEPSNPA